MKISVPSTDEMDHITPDERRALVGWCYSCDKWVEFERGDMLFQCCDNMDLESRSVQTRRTFNPKKSPPRKKKR